MLRMMLSMGTGASGGRAVATSLPVVTTTGEIGSSAVATAATWTNAVTSGVYSWETSDEGTEDWSAIPDEAALTYSAIADLYDGKQCRFAEAGVGPDGVTVYARSDPFQITYDAPVLTDVGALTGAGTVGTVLTLTGLTYTGSGVTVAYDWRGDGVSLGAVSAASLTLTAAHDGLDITCVATVTNSGGSDDDETDPVAVVYAVPVWASDKTWNESEDTGVQTFELASFLTGTATLSITSGGTGVTLTGTVLSIDTGTIGLVTNQAIVVQASNSGGTDSITVTLSVVADIGELDFQTLSRLWTTTGRTVNSTVGSAVAYVDNALTPGTNDLSFTDGTATLRQHANGNYYLELATNSRATLTGSLAFLRDKTGGGIIAACKPTDLTGEASLLQFQRTTDNSALLELRHVDGVPRAAARRQFAEASSTTSLWGASVSTNQVISSIVDWTGASITVRVNGVAGTAGTLPTGGNSQNSDGFGAQLFNNTTALLTQDWTGDLYGLVFYNTPKTTDAIALIETRLALLYAPVEELTAPVETTNFTIVDADAKSGDTVTVTVGAFPSGATGFYYRVGTGGTWTTSGLSATGSFDISGLAWEVSNSLYFRWKFGATDGPASAVATATPTFHSSCRFVSTTGSDVAAGTYAAPWRNPNKFNALTAGQVGYIRPGTYTGSSGHIVAANSGTASVAVSVIEDERPSSPITVTTLPGEEWLAILDGTGTSDRGIIELRAKDYWIVSNLRLVNANSDGIYIEGTSGQQHGHHIFEYLQIDFVGNSGIFCCGLVMGSTIPVDTWRTIDILIQRCDITRTNEPTSGNECISGGGGVDGILVRWNHIHDSRQYGIDFKLGVKNGEAYGNYLHHLQKHGLYSDCACRTNENISFHDNWVESCGILPGGGNGITFAREADRGGLGTGAQKNHGYFQNLINNVCYNNVVINSGNYGVLLSKHGADVSVLMLDYDGATSTDFDIGEQVTGGTSGAKRSIAGHIATTGTTGTLYLVAFLGTDNATAFQNNETITAAGASALANGVGTTGMPGAYEVEFTHNTVYNSTNANEIKIDNLTTCPGRAITIANNIFWDESGTMINDTNSSATKTNNTVTGPDFTDSANNDFTLQATSDADGAGSATWRIPEDYSGYVPVAGVPWSPDFTPRTPATRAATPDCGAFERV
jgi:hypothetical protein